MILADTQHVVAAVVPKTPQIAAPVALATPRDTWTPESRTLMDRIERDRAALAAFDVDEGRKTAGGIIALTSLTTTLTGCVARAFLPLPAAVGVSMGLSLATATIGMIAVNRALHGAMEPGALIVPATCAIFMPILGMAGPENVLSSACLATTGILLSLAAGMGFGKLLESSHAQTAQRLDDARRLVEKYEACRQQHDAVKAALAEAAA